MENNTNLDVIAMTRELGAAIQADPRYKEYIRAKEINDNDTELQKLIGDFNLTRQKIQIEINKSADDKDNKKIAELNKEMQGFYGQIMGNNSMNDYNSAKAAFDTLVQQVNAIISGSVNGEDPLTMDTDASCGSGCSSCSGCG